MPKWEVLAWVIGLGAVGGFYAWALGVTPGEMVALVTLGVCSALALSLAAVFGRGKRVKAGGNA